MNLGLWRDYIEDYLRKRSDINSEMTLMVRQMQPTNAGLPVQLYFSPAQPLGWNMSIYRLMCSTMCMQPCAVSG